MGIRIVIRNSRRRLIGATGAAALTVASLASITTPANAARTAADSVASPVQDVCGNAPVGYARCFAEIHTDSAGTWHAIPAAATTVPSGFGPADLRAAHQLPIIDGANQTIAIVDAGDDTTAEADLAVYRSTYGLPPCTTANGCFHKTNQHGAATPLPADQGWGVQIALDLDLASAACPQCRILLVEADSALGSNLAPAVDTAFVLGASEVSNSYGITKSSRSADSQTGVAVYTSSGVPGWIVVGTGTP